MSEFARMTLGSWGLPTGAALGFALSWALFGTFPFGGLVWVAFALGAYIGARLSRPSKEKS